jgi:hypothetical protein
MRRFQCGPCCIKESRQNFLLKCTFIIFAAHLATKTLSKDIRSSGRYLNLGPPEYETDVAGLVKGDHIRALQCWSIKFCYVCRGSYRVDMCTRARFYVYFLLPSLPPSFPIPWQPKRLYLFLSLSIWTQYRLRFEYTPLHIQLLKVSRCILHSGCLRSTCKQTRHR